MADRTGDRPTGEVVGLSSGYTGEGIKTIVPATANIKVKLRPAAAPPAGAHEWVSFPDPAEDRTWIIDVTFLLSSWECIYGRGCQGVLTGPTPELAQGCCSYGAHFTGAADAARVERAAAQLTPSA